MFVLSQPAKQMSGFPFVYQNLSICRFIANLLGQSAMIFVRVCQHNTLNVFEAQSVAREGLSKGFFCLGRFRANIDQCHGIFAYQIDIYVTDIKWCGDR